MILTRSPRTLLSILMDNIYTYTNPESFFSKRAIGRFWASCERRYIKATIYPAIGKYLKNSGTTRVLDIGARWYDANNRDLFCNSNIIYWMIDIKRRPKYLKCDYFLRVSILDLPDIYHNLESYFDVVISIGVLGFFKFDKKTVNRYLESVFRILKPNGILVLKLDTSLMKEFEEEFKIDFDVICKYFTPFSTADLPEEKVVCDENWCATFYSLRKRFAPNEEKGAAS